MSERVKAKLVIVLVTASLLTLGGCGWVQKLAWHIGAGTVGLQRTITLYSADGHKIREWNGQFYVEIEGATASWIEGGKETKIAGTFIVEQR